MSIGERRGGFVVSFLQVCKSSEVSNLNNFLYLCDFPLRLLRSGEYSSQVHSRHRLESSSTKGSSRFSDSSLLRKGGEKSNMQVIQNWHFSLDLTFFTYLEFGTEHIKSKEWARNTDCPDPLWWINVSGEEHGSQRETESSYHDSFYKLVSQPVVCNIPGRQHCSTEINLPCQTQME